MSKKKKKGNDKESLFSKFKSLWSVPRYRAFIKLGLYVLFFLILFVIYEISMLFNPNKNNVISNNKYNTFL